jgi:hypothetical protein
VQGGDCRSGRGLRPRAAQEDTDRADAAVAAVAGGRILALGSSTMRPGAGAGRTRATARQARAPGGDGWHGRGPRPRAPRATDCNKKGMNSSS